jgi:exopolysaccharide biosynthesis protein
METYDAKGYDIEDIKARGAVQVWSFGPVLLDENGQVRTRYSMPTAVSQTNPRSAIGYYEPGHYCFLVADGRQEGYAKGFTIPELAQIFKDLGCVKAYNLDGGGSAVMVYNHQRFSKQSNGADRELGDILVIRESAVANGEAAE